VLFQVFVFDAEFIVAHGLFAFLGWGRLQAGETRG
jgi:hypothetical protein